MVWPLGGAEGEDRGQQKLTAKLVAVMIKKKVAIFERRKWMGGEGREMKEGRNERKREDEFRNKNR